MKTVLNKHCSKMNVILLSLFMAATNSLAWTYGTTNHVWNTGNSILGSSPAIDSNGVAYIGDENGHFYAFNPDGTTNQVWTAGVSTFYSPAIGSNGLIYVGAGSNFYAFNPNGTTQHVWTAGGLFSASPAINSNGTICVGSEDGNFYAFNPDGTTQCVWSLGGAIVSSSAAISSNGTIYVGCWDEYLYSLNPNGTTNNRVFIPWRLTVSPAIDSNGVIYIGGNDSGGTAGALYAINPDFTTNHVWSDGKAFGASPVIGSNGVVYIGTYSSNFYAFNPDGTTQHVWHVGSVIGSTAALGSDGTIYVGSHDNKLYAFNPDGTTNYVWVTGGDVISSPTITTDGIIYVGSRDANLYAFQGTGTLANTPWPKFRKTIRNTGSGLVAPVGISASDGTYSNTIRVTWQAGCEATGYQVWRNTNNSPNSATFLNGTANTSYDDDSSLKDTIYYYWIIATNSSYISVFSASDTGWRTDPPVITSNPQSMTNNPGTPATFGVAAVATTPLYYQWQKNATNIIGATDTNYTIGTVQESDEGGYRCIVTNIAGGATSSVATLTVNNLPAIGLSTTLLYYSATYGGSSPGVQTLILTNLGQIAFSYSNTVTYGTQASGWFSLVPVTGLLAGSASQVLTGAVNSTSLAGGVYYATNTVIALAATNNPQYISVVLTVAKANQAIMNFMPTNESAFATTSTTWLAAQASSGLPVSFTVGSGPGLITGLTNLTFTGAGAVSIIASQTGNESWNAAPNVTNSLNVSKVNQVINFPVIPEQMATASVALAATASSGLAVTFSMASGPGVISGDNILVFTGAGVVQVVAGQGGNAIWNAAPSLTNSVTVHDVATLAAPQNLVASDGTFTDKVELTWSVVSGAGGYQVWRSSANNSATAVNLSNATLPSYNDNSSIIRSATMFYYWVKAFNSVATSEFSVVDSGFCRMITDPAIISGQPMVGDYDGDNKADPAVYDLNNGRLFAWLSSANYLLVTPVVTFQAATGDLPVAGDFDGDKLADPGVFQRLTGSWYIWLSSAGYYRVGPLSFGVDLNDMPIPADYDGDGKADPAICNAGTEWYVWLSSAGYFRVGPLTIFRVDAADIPAPGQFDADLMADPGVYQASSGNWYVWLSSAGYYRVGPVPLGTTGEHLAVPADYDGDGLADPAAYVPTNGLWRIWESGNGYALKELPLR